MKNNQISHKLLKKRPGNIFTILELERGLKDAVHILKMKLETTSIAKLTVERQCVYFCVLWS